MEKFKWSPKMIGLSLGMVGLLVGLVQGVLIRYINPKIGNEKSVYFGIALYALGLILFAFASSSWMMFIFLIMNNITMVFIGFFQRTMRYSSTIPLHFGIIFR